MKLLNENDVTSITGITDLKKAKSIADQINTYAQTNNIDTQKIRDVLTKYSALPKDVLKDKNTELEGQKALLKQRLKNNLSSPEQFQ